jgi:hypothetical protein
MRADAARMQVVHDALEQRGHHLGGGRYVPLARLVAVTCRPLSVRVERGGYAARIQVIHDALSVVAARPSSRWWPLRAVGTSNDTELEKPKRRLQGTTPNCKCGVLRRFMNGRP